MPPRVHPIDRSCLQRYVTSRRIRHAISAAYSTNLNPRNLEVDWLSPYNHTFSDLVDFMFDGALTIRQQYDLWLSKSTLDLYKLLPEAFESVNKGGVDSDSDDNSAEDTLLLPDLPPPAVAPPAPPIHGAPAAEGNNPAGRPQRTRKPPPEWPADWIEAERVRAILYPDGRLTAKEQIAALTNLVSRAAIADDPSDANLADASFATIGTVPDNKGRDEFPDLLVCHTHALITPQPTTEAKIHGWERRMWCKVVHHCFPAIMEIKGGPPRSMHDPQVRLHRTERLLTEAEGDLFDYLCTAFARDLCADRAIAISAAGPYWRWIEVRREEVDEDVLNEDDLEKHKVFMKRFAKAHIYALGSDESDAELTRLRDEALIPILEQHPTYPSTMVSNPQRS